MEKRRVEIPFRNTKLVADVLGSDPRFLFMHGGGGGDRTRFDAVRDHLAAQGVSSAAVDFIGHGETGGSLLGSSLHERTDQALATITQLEMRQPLTLWGASMSGYTAIKLSEHLDIANLILVVPAAYDTAAYDLPFGDEFSKVIRQPESWLKSDAWELLSRFTGKLLIIAGEHDEIVPQAVVDRMYNSATNAASRQLVLLNTDHHIMRYLATHPNDRARVESAVDTLVLS